MYFIITGTSQHFSRLIINVDQNNIGFFHKGRYINNRIEQQNEKEKKGGRVHLMDALELGASIKCTLTPFLSVVASLLRLIRIET